MIVFVVGYDARTRKTPGKRTTVGYMISLSQTARKKRKKRRQRTLPNGGYHLSHPSKAEREKTDAFAQPKSPNTLDVQRRVGTRCESKLYWV